jgi:putative ABC transport system substrate-binding protein
MMKRREFITVLGGAAAWPTAVRAQPRMMVIGFLSSRSPGESDHLVAAFRRRLKETGFVEGENVVIAFRWAEGRYDRLPALAADLVNLRVAVIAAPGGTVTALATKAATATIPVVFTMGGDPVKLGLVASLNRPGGNITGVSQLTSFLVKKRLELLRELIPATRAMAFLANPNSPNAEPETQEIQQAADTLGLQVRVLSASNERELETAFMASAKRHDGALVVTADGFFDSRHDQIVRLAAHEPGIQQKQWIVGRRGTIIRRKAKTRLGRWPSRGETTRQRPHTRPVRLVPICKSKSAHLLAN